MSTLPLHILVIGVGNPIPTFISRRMTALSNAGVKVTLVVQHGQQIPISSVHMLRIGGKLSLPKQISLLVNALFSPFKFWELISLRKELGFLQRLRWGVKYFPLSRIKQPDIAHIQWLSHITEFQWLRHYFSCPLITSARGSQVTVYPITRKGYSAQIQAAIQAADYIHCVSHDIAKACEKLGAPQEKLFVNYNGIDLSKFQPVDKGNTGATFTLISVGSLMWRKGFLYQLLILKKLIANGKDVQLIIIGDGLDREGLEYTATTLQLQENVSFVGKKNEAEVQTLLTSADVYLSTSAAEGLANSVVEAMACGLPVIAFACEGMEEIIVDNENGFIIPFGAIEGVEEKVTFFMDHPDRKRIMGVKARTHVENRFDQTYWVDHMIRKYEEITAG